MAVSLEEGMTHVVLRYDSDVFEIEETGSDQKMVVKRLEVEELNHLVAQTHNADTVNKVLKAIAEIMSAELKDLDFDLPKGTFSISDAHGKLTQGEDVRRTIEIARVGKRDCVMDIDERLEFRKIKKLECKDRQFEQQLAELQAQLKSQNADFDVKIKKAKDEVQRNVDRVDQMLRNEVRPTVDDLCRDRTQLQKEVRAIQEKLANINLQELREMAEASRILKEEVRGALVRVENVEKNYNRDKMTMEANIKRNFEDMHELRRYISGKIEVCIDTDADLRRDLQLTNERMQLLADDLRLQSDKLSDLTLKTAGALEESEELRTLLGTVREDNEHLRSECGQVRTRVHCIEGAATDQWQGFAPGVLYFRRFDAFAKGGDVYLSKDHSIATTHGFFAITGQIINNVEGLCVGDGPCRRFGTPGSFASYFEIEIDAIQKAPEGAGGLYVGFSLQNNDEIKEHPKMEFDGWLIGGSGKAVITRASPYQRADGDDLKPLTSIQPAAFGSDISQDSAKKASEALQMLRVAMKPGPRGTFGEFTAQWSSENLRICDRVGVLFKCHRNGGARMRVLVNGEVQCTHEFSVDSAPPADAVGFLTPVLRLAGTGKAAKLIPGVSPPGRALVENP
jgi:hypothetical protein